MQAQRTGKCKCRIGVESSSLPVGTCRSTCTDHAPPLTAMSTNVGQDPTTHSTRSVAKNGTVPKNPERTRNVNSLPPPVRLSHIPKELLLLRANIK